MKHVVRPLFYIVLLVLLNTVPVRSREVRMVWPVPGKVLWPGSTYFFRGHVVDGADSLTINGKAIPLYKKEAFCAEVPFDTSAPVLECQWIYQGSTSEIQEINYACPPPKQERQHPQGPEPVDRSWKNWLVTGEARTVKGRWEPRGGYDCFLEPGSVYSGRCFSADSVELFLADAHPVIVDINKLRTVDQDADLNTLKHLSFQETSRTLTYAFSPANPITARWIITPGLKQAELLLYKTKTAIDRTSNLLSANSRGCDWAQDQHDICRIRFFTDFEPIWGVSVRFSANQMMVNIKKPILQGGHTPVICIDPGHGGADSGAIGPTEVPEKEVNLLFAKALEVKLKKAGYKVIVTRNSDETVSLDDRVITAIEHNADLFISIHYNATTGNPYEARGVETYFYTMEGLALAQKIHPHLAAAMDIPDKGVRFGNYHVLRNHEIPSVLCEIDYMILPEAEDQARTLKYIQRNSQAVLEGIQSYLQSSL